MRGEAPVRTCVGCGKRELKHNLVRVVQNEKQGIVLDAAARRPGRGAYLHREAGCIEQGLTPRRLARAFRGPVARGGDLAGAILAATEQVAM